MSPARLVVFGISFGALSGALVAIALIRHPPAGSERTNVRGLVVPAILGGPLVLAGVGVALTPGSLLLSPRIGGSVAGLCIALGAAGFLDDVHGDRGARGFKGHLRAALSGRVTTGLLKLLIGGAGGFAVGLAVADSWQVVTTALLVSLSANLFNLLDLAPGRAGKVGVALWIPLLVWGAEVWAVASAGVLGALLVCLPLDLRERAMLGDAGANPLGAVLGLGLALALPPWAGALAAGLLLGLNLSSERWSFSAVISRVGPLRVLDRIGRVDPRQHDASTE
ncbi:MAG: hypothetical protein M3454_04745 [Actinomycetota bacterium]|nr:hypothetical protein [Actinomycetota bacterium]